MKISNSVICAVLLLFSGCSKTGHKVGATDSANGFGSSENAVETGAPVVGIPSRDFLFEEMSPDPGYGAYGYCLFTKRPDSHNRKRFIKVASAYLNVLEHTGAFDSVPRNQLMPTYWLLKKEAPEAVFEDTPQAELLVDFYDYPRAKVLLGHVAKSDSEGPILVAWQQPFEERGGIVTALVFDLSNFSDEDMERAIQIWISRIVKDPSFWNRGFQLVKFREEFRSFLQRYGEQILAVINTN